MQYHLPDEEKGLVTAFRRERSPYPGFVCDLNNIDETAEYRVSVSESYNQAPFQTMRGSELKHIELKLNEPQSSLILKYELV